MTTAVETHWELSIETDVPGQTTWRCGCGDTGVIDRADARAITQARQQWNEHDCGGRALELLLDAFPGAVLVRGDSVDR